MMVLIGTGAVATFLAERLADAGVEFRLFGGESPRTKILAQRFGHETVCTDPTRLPKNSEWVVVTKTWQNLGKVEILKRAPSPTSILVLQNGLSPESNWSHLAAKVERGVSTYGARSQGPGRVVASDHGTIRLPLGSTYSKRFRQAGLRVEELANMKRLIWQKLAVNASLNVVCTLFALPNGGMLKHRKARSLTRLAANEVRAVAKVVGVSWGAKTPWEIVCGVASQTPNNICSTLADFRQQRPSEYEDINGAILALARHYDVETPTLLELDRAYRDLTSAKLRTEVVTGGVPRFVVKCAPAQLPSRMEHRVHHSRKSKCPSSAESTSHSIRISESGTPPPNFATEVAPEHTKLPLLGGGQGVRATA